MMLNETANSLAASVAPASRRQYYKRPARCRRYITAGGTMNRPDIALPYPDEHVDIEAIYTKPKIDPSAWVAQNAIVNGRVTLKARSSVWYNCVLRGDSERIEVGEESNIQDGSILHIDRGFPCIVGNRVTLGHNAIVHGCEVHDGALIGIAATVL